MACLLMHRACKVCGKFHDFFLAEGELVADKRYTYTCPETKQQEYLWDILTVEAIPSPPPGGVELHPTGLPSERHGVGP